MLNNCRAVRLAAMSAKSCPRSGSCKDAYPTAILFLLPLMDHNYTNHPVSHFEMVCCRSITVYTRVTWRPHQVSTYKYVVYVASAGAVQESARARTRTAVTCNFSIPSGLYLPLMDHIQINVKNLSV